MVRWFYVAANISHVSGKKGDGAFVKMIRNGLYVAAHLAQVLLGACCVLLFLLGTRAIVLLCAPVFLIADRLSWIRRVAQDRWLWCLPASILPTTYIASRG